MPFQKYNPKTNTWMSCRAQQDVVHVIMEITPKLAAQWLAGRNTRNRKIKNGTVNKYVTAIENSKWFQTNHSIGFYRDGSLSDGQHTLWAVVKTQKTIRYTVTFNIDPKASVVIDDNIKRSTRDHASLLYGDKATPLALETMNYTLSVHRVQSKITKQQEMKFYDANKKILEKLSAIAQTKRTKKVTVSPVLSAIFTAIKAETDPVDEKTAYRFLALLCDANTQNDQEEGVKRLRDWLMSQTSTEKGADRSLTFWQTQKVLKKFATGEKLSPDNLPRISVEKSKRKPFYLIADEEIPHPCLVDRNPDKPQPKKRTYGKRRPKTTSAKKTIFKVSVEQQG